MRAWTVLMLSVVVVVWTTSCSDDDPSGAGGGTTVTVGGNTGTGGTTASGAGTGNTGTGNTGTGAGSTGGASTFSCASPDPDWLLCEDFETGAGDWDSWWASTDFIGGSGTDDRGRVDLSSDQHRSGSWAAYMPASPSSGYQGGALDWWACDGAQQTNCSLRSYDTLYFRTWVRFANDHRYIHHFLSIGGSQPDDFWPHGTAGCMPNGSLHMGTTVDCRPDDHESFFYTYFPGMNCDTNCGNYMDVNAVCQECASKGLPTCDVQPQCCWGNHYGPSTPHYFPVGQWFCFEMMMTANTVGSSDGEMAYWVNGQEIHRETGMNWRSSPTLALNRVNLKHYITSGDAEGFSNRVWFDDVVVSTSPVGCN